MVIIVTFYVFTSNAALILDSLRRKYNHITWSPPSHYLNQYWNIVNCTLRKKPSVKFQSKFMNFLIEENAFENVVCKIVPISSRPQRLTTFAITHCDVVYPLTSYCGTQAVFTTLLPSTITILFVYTQFWFYYSVICKCITHGYGNIMLIVKSTK